MTIDMRQFHQTFFEEGLEGIAIMESELLRIEKGMTGRHGTDLFDADKESLNNIFRAAHSIKGGSATFGFSDIAKFSHTLETVLQNLREGRCAKTRHLITVLLQSVDCLRNLFSAAKDKTSIDDVLINKVTTLLEALQCDSDQENRLASPSDPAPASPQVSSAKIGWRIRFHPQPQLFCSGNDPLRIFRELSSLGELTVNVDTTDLADWAKLDPESCYLRWALELDTDAEQETIEEAFAWVKDECELEISPITQAPLMPLTDTASFNTNAAATSSIRISTTKVDAVIDLVGELVITQTMLNRFANGFSEEDIPKLLAGLGQLERNTRDLQESVLNMRMLPIGFAFNKLPRMVRDVSQHLGKKVELKISGETTELDKTVIERVSDSLLHLVRNCVDHGIETAEERLAINKPETGTIRLNAYHEGGNVVIEIEDDGRGLQRDKIAAKALEHGLIAHDAELSPEQIDQLIFLPGFSTVETITDVSGRGVGTDTVRTNVRSLGGNVEVMSLPGKGTKFTLQLPLTLAIMDGLTITVGAQTYILPMLNIVESIHVDKERIIRPGGGAEKFSVREEILPLTRLYELFNVTPRSTDISKGIVVVVEAEGKKAGLLVDDLLGQQQVVVKNLEQHYRKVHGVATATILGDGEVALILDMPALVRSAYMHTTQENYIPETAVQ